MVWGWICSQGADVIRILVEIMTTELNLAILINVLIASIQKFDFIGPVNQNIKTMILNINLVHVSPGCYTTVPNLLILLFKVLILTLSKIFQKGRKRIANK